MAVNRATQNVTTTLAPSPNGNGVSSGASSSPTEELSSGQTVDLIREMFRPRVEQPQSTQEPVKEGQSGENTQETDKPKSEASSGTELAPGQRIITDDELTRLIQAETDRREARRTEAERKRSEKELLTKDPYKYAQLKIKEDEEAEQQRLKEEESSTVVRDNIFQYDRQVLDPLFLAVPTSEARSAIEQSIATHPQGPIVGRGEAARKLIELIRTQAQQDGLTQARTTLINDEAFIKEILARRGGQRVDPDVVSPVGASQRGASVEDDWNGFIRNGRRGFTG